MSETTFGLVHGAWHGAWAWEKVEGELQSQGYNTVSVDLPIDNPRTTFDDHAALVVDSLQRYDNVVLVGHSRGGNIIPRVANLRSVGRMVFLCGAFHASLPTYMTQTGPQMPSSAMPDFTAGVMPVTRGVALYNPAKARDIFYHDCTDEDAQWAMSKLRPQSRNTERRMEHWPDVSTGYILCQEDRVINPAWSRAAAQHYLGVKPIELPGGHSPFLSRPQQLAETLVRLAND